MRRCNRQSREEPGAVQREDSVCVPEDYCVSPCLTLSLLE